MPYQSPVSFIQVPDGAATNARTVTLLILQAGSTNDIVRRKYGDYHDIFTSLFRKSVSAHPDGLTGCNFRIKTYDIVNEHREYPTPADLEQASAILITGSPATIYEYEPWSVQLTRFVRDLRITHPRIKLVGICYGHQVIALAHGASCKLNPKGWELGVRPLRLTEIGKKLLKRDDDEDRDVITIHQVHRDIVPELPAGFACLGSTPDCDIHGMVYPENPTTIKDARILTLQGHPEFFHDIVTTIIDIREEKGILTKELADQSRQYAALHDDGIYLGAIVLRFIAQNTSMPY